MTRGADGPDPPDEPQLVFDVDEDDDDEFVPRYVPTQRGSQMIDDDDADDDDDGEGDEGDEKGEREGDVLYPDEADDPGLADVATILQMKSKLMSSVKKDGEDGSETRTVEAAPTDGKIRLDDRGDPIADPGQAVTDKERSPKSPKSDLDEKSFHVINSPTLALKQGMTGTERGKANWKKVRRENVSFVLRIAPWRFPTPLPLP